jgi:hypothetical protein
MGYKNKFTTPAENAMEHFSGWSGVNCDTCKKGTTKAQLLYSMRIYGKPLCRTCQTLKVIEYL